MKHLVVIYNPRSGGAYKHNQLEKLFDEAGLKPVKYIAIDGRIRRRIGRFITAKATFAVAGGDGTISAMADHLSGTGATLAPLPGGTLNHFAHDLGIPDDMSEAIKRLATAKRYKVDVASVNNVTFINNSSIGLYPASLQARVRLEDRFGKWPAAIIGGLRALVSFRTYRLRIGTTRVTSPFVFVGNNAYSIDDLRATGRVRLNEGILSVYVARASSRWKLFILFLHALTGRLRTADDFEHFTVDDQIIIESSRRSIHVSHDGEIEKLGGRLTYRVHKKALWVL